MSCPHPQVAQVFDRVRGTMTCSFCGEVVADQQYEIDPAFNRGEKPAGGRPPPGYARPMRTTVLSNPGTNRPSIENARRGMQAIARQLEIGQDDVDKAVAIFRLAVSNNAIAGSRPSALCACLYAVCRRGNTPHTIFDFADATKETPQSILGYLRTICRATSTQLPSPDPTFYVHRLAQLLNLGAQTEDITILAVKILRAMNAEWLGYGRRPLGLCGAAVLVAANVFGVQRSVHDVVNFVRLSPDTIFLRMSEFLKTDAASLVDIDDYKPSTTALPPALLRKQSHDWVQESSDRYLAHLYYSLLNEAKQSAPATEERSARWREFIHLHCKLHNLEVVEDVLDLTTLTPSDQLAILGAKDVVPTSAETVSSLKETENTRLVVSAAVAALGNDVAPAAPAAATPSRPAVSAFANSLSANGIGDYYGGMKQEGQPTGDPFATGGVEEGGEGAVGSSFDKMWGAMDGGVGESVLDQQQQHDANSFGFESGSADPFGASSNDFGFGGGFEDDGFGGFDSGGGFGMATSSSSGAGQQVKKQDETAAKAEGIKREMMSSQVTSVHAMLERFEQLRALNNDVTSHVANVVKRAKFDIIVLPPVHSDLGLAPPPQPGAEVSADPFATATLTTPSGAHIAVKSEPASQIHLGVDAPVHDMTSEKEDGDTTTAAAPPVLKISELLSSRGNITSTSDAADTNAAAAQAQRHRDEAEGGGAQLAPDLQVYIIQDMEVRLRLEAAGKRVFGDKWDAGAARGDDEVLQAEIRACVAHGDDNVEVGADGNIIGPDSAPQRRRAKIQKHATAAQAIKASLRNKGASQIDVSAIFGDEDGAVKEGGDFDPNNGDMSDADDGGWDE